MSDQHIKQDFPGYFVEELEGGNKLYAERNNPYGHFSLRLEEGEVPQEYAGTYISFHAVQTAMKRFKDTYKPPKSKLKKNA